MFTVTSGDIVIPWHLSPAPGEDQATLTSSAEDRDCAIGSGAYTIHLIEGARDDRHFAGMLRSILPRDGAPVITHDSADAFLDDIDDHAPGVVIVNCRIADAGGMTLLANLRTGDYAFAVILLAPRDDVALAVRAMKDGAVDVLTTPCDPHALIASIDAGFAQIRQRERDQGATRAALALIETLSKRELSVLRGLIRGWSNKTMAHDLDLSPRTVEIHRANLMQKLGAGHLSDVLRIVYAARLVDRL